MANIQARLARVEALLTKQAKQIKPDGVMKVSYSAGDIVEVKVDYTWVRATVISGMVYDQLGRAYVPTRRHGVMSDGRRYPRCEKNIDNVRHVRHHDPVTANVFADYLDERGEHRAAEMLRQAFPVADGKVASAEVVS